jgi:hypothetical protein
MNITVVLYVCIRCVVLADKNGEFTITQTPWPFSPQVNYTDRQSPKQFFFFLESQHVLAQIGLDQLTLEEYTNEVQCRYTIC